MISALRRVGRSLGVLLVVVGLTFAIFYVAPIDPALQMCGKPCSPEDLEAALPVLTGMVMDVDADLAAAAELALEQLAIRLDRPGLRVSLEG